MAYRNINYFGFNLMWCLLAVRLLWATPVWPESPMTDIEQMVTSGDTIHSPEMGHWHFEIQGRYRAFDNLDEYSTFSPLFSAESGAHGWKRKWKDEGTVIKISRALINTKHFSLRPGVGLGIVRGYFTASNHEAAFSEKWKTENALLWALSADFKIRQTPERGPFFNIGYGYNYAEAEEDRESVISQRPGPLSDYRDARFKWKTNELSFSLGWKMDRVTPVVGIGYSCLELKKSLRHDIPEAFAGTLKELEDIRVLNSRESKYRYRSQSNWAPLIRLECRLSPVCFLTAGVNFVNNRCFDLALQYGF
jgi:hypothetical protein